VRPADVPMEILGLEVKRKRRRQDLVKSRPTWNDKFPATFLRELAAPGDAGDAPFPPTPSRPQTDRSAYRVARRPCVEGSDFAILCESRKLGDRPRKTGVELFGNLADGAPRPRVEGIKSAAPPR
jgi:hypothetical protein